MVSAHRVAAPPAGDLQVPRRVSLQSETEALNQRDRAMVLRLDVRLESMESVLAKCQPDDALQSCTHVVTSMMWR